MAEILKVETTSIATTMLITMALDKIEIIEILVIETTTITFQEIDKETIIIDHLITETMADLIDKIEV